MDIESTASHFTIPNLAASPLWEGEHAPLHLIKFEAGGFDPHLFARHDIACPLNIARSVTKRQAEFFAGRLAAQRALALFGLSHMEIRTGPHREPLWPLGLHGSIAHHQYLAGAVAFQQPPGRGAAFGIDIETILCESKLPMMMGMVVSKAELACLQRWHGQLTLNKLVTLTFSAKESFFKAAFPLVGRYFDFDAVAVKHVDPAKQCLTLVVRQSPSTAIPVGTEVTVHFSQLDEKSLFTSCCWRLD